MKQPKSAQAFVDRGLKSLRKACVERKEAGDKRSSEDYRKLEVECKAGDFGSAKVAGGYATVLGKFHAMRGSYSVNGQKDETGWRQIDLGARFAYWQVKMALGARLRALKTGEHALTLAYEVDVLALLLCYSYVLHLEEYFAELRRLWGLVTSVSGLTTYNDGGLVSKWRNVKPNGFVYSEGHVDRFVTHLFDKSRFGPRFELYEEVERLTLGPYQEVVDAWDDEGEKFAEALTIAATFHLRNIDDTANIGRRLPFNHQLGSLVPWEIAAIYKLRDAEGLRTPKIDHPLMNLPAASLTPRKVSEIDEPIFGKLEQLYTDNCRIEDYL